MYDPVVKVPLVIKWPDGRSAGSVSRRLVSNVDLAPTLCRAAGLKPAAEMRGEDLGVDGPQREVGFCEYGPKLEMHRTQSDKLILAGWSPGESLFFDLRKDPLEMHNLYHSPEVQAKVKRLTAAIAAWRPQPAPERYVDLQAPQIQGPNVPPPGLKHREEIIEYFRAKMQQRLGGTP